MEQLNQLIESFLSHYKQKRVFFNELARLAAKQCEKALKSDGIKAIVTYRAKTSERLKEKIIQRCKEKRYQNEEAISNDIIDLSGVRIALYYPADRMRVSQLIEKNFKIIKDKKFPNEVKLVNNRFDGYHADHYRVEIRSDTLEENKEYSDHIVEIQVASVLMHAWSEVNHDLGYKQFNGELSQQEKSILDVLNGLVLVGEGLLEQLQTAFQNRVSYQKQPFINQYELAAYLFERIKKIKDIDKGIEPLMEKVEELFYLLQDTKWNNANGLDQLLNEKLNGNIINFPICEQILDIIFEKNINQFDKYYSLFDDDQTYKNICKDIVKKRILFKRYITCIAYYKNFNTNHILKQVKQLQGLWGSLRFISSVYHWILDNNIYSDYYNVINDLDTVKGDFNLILTKIKNFKDPDSKKALEWAKTGQLKLPEKV